jgi:hypothetical protein
MSQAIFWTAEEVAAKADEIYPISDSIDSGNAREYWQNASNRRRD